MMTRVRSTVLRAYAKGADAQRAHGLADAAGVDHTFPLNDEKGSFVVGNGAVRDVTRHGVALALLTFDIVTSLLDAARVPCGVPTMVERVVAT
jgi:hypothetical protein